MKSRSAKPVVGVGLMTCAAIWSSTAASAFLGSPAPARASSAFGWNKKTISYRQSTRHMVSTTTDEIANEIAAEDLAVDASSQSLLGSEKETQFQKRVVEGSFISNIQEKIGTVDDARFIHPELASGDVPRMFSSLQYTTTDDGKLSASHAAGSVLGAAVLVAGTTIGAGILALPTATAAAGFVPSTAALVSAWIFMTMSGLLVAELKLNRMGETGRPGLGLLEIYKSSLGESWSAVCIGAYLFFHYTMMVAYISNGGNQLDAFLSSNVPGVLSSNVPGVESLLSVPGAGQGVFAAIVGQFLFAASPSVVERVNNVLVAGIFATFAAIIGIGAGSADFGALVDPANQHPEQVMHAFPILFLALVYQNVVPTVVTQLEGDRRKISQAIVGGTTLPLLMFLAWNAVFLGNVVGTDFAGVDPVMLLQNGAGQAGEVLGPLISAFSGLAIVTSVIGFTYGLADAWTDVFNINVKSVEYEKWKLPLFAMIFGPPLALSVANPDVFYHALEYGGAFGVSTLFLVLPPLMVWKQRYSDVDKPLVTKPMVPLGKLPLGSMWKAAATLILEQGAEKLGVIDFLSDKFHL